MKLSQEDYFMAINDAKEAIRSNPEDKNGYISLGDALDRKGAIAEAERAYRKALEIDPTDSEIKHKLDTMSYVGQMLSSIEEKAGAVGVDLENEDTLVSPVIQSICVSELEGNVEALVDEADRNPYNLLSQFVLGTAYYLLEMLDEAEEQYKKAIDIDYGYFYAHLGLGVIYQAREKLDNAIEELSLARDINPDNISVHYNLGTAYMEKLELDLAIAEFDKALSIHPGFYNAYMCLGMIYLRLRRKDDAKRALQLYLRIAPESDQAGRDRAIQLLRAAGGERP